MPADQQQDFLFTVTLKVGEEAISGAFGAAWYQGTAEVATGKLNFNASGEAKVYLHGGEKLKLSGIPEGASWTVTEAAVDGFTTAVNNSSDNTARSTNATLISATAPRTAAFTNTRKTGELKIHKQVISPLAADKEAEYTFTVYLDADINKSFGDVEFKNGVATVTIKGGESKTISGLPVGVHYTVVEETPAGMTASWTGNTGTGPAGSIKASGETVQFINRRKTGELEVTKAVVGGSDTDKFNFTVTFSHVLKSTEANKLITITKADKNDATVTGYPVYTINSDTYNFELKNGEKLTMTGLPAGVTYTVTETEADQNGFVTTSGGDTGTIGADSVHTARFTNTKAPGGLVVSKRVVSALDRDHTGTYEIIVTLDNASITGTYGDATFEVKGEGDEARSVATLNLKDGDVKIITGLPDGTHYTVTEDLPDGMTNNIGSGIVGDIEHDKTKLAQVTNTRKTGELTISKTLVSGITSDADEPFLFTLELTDQYGDSIEGNYSGVYVEGGKAQLWLKGGQSITLKGLPIGTGYTVTEDSDPRFTTTVDNTETLMATGTITADDPETTDEGQDESKSTVTFTNTRKTGELEISKTVVSSVPADHTKEYEFTIQLNDKISGEFEAVYGPYTPASEIIASTPRSLRDVGDGDGEDEQTETPKVKFTDGTSEVIKLTGGQKVIIKGLPAGVKYTVTEKSEPLMTTTATGATGTITKTDGKWPASAFTNTRLTGALEVRKTVISSDNADLDRRFRFKIYLNTKFDEGMIFGGVKRSSNGHEDDSFTLAFNENGESVVFELENGESILLSDLPAGIDYQVVEVSEDDEYNIYSGDTADGFYTTAGGEYGVIAPATALTSEYNISPGAAHFTNIKQEGGLVVSKKVISAIDADHDREYVIRVFALTNEKEPEPVMELKSLRTMGDGSESWKIDTSINGPFGDADFHGGVATLHLKDGEVAVITGLPVGTPYIVMEFKGENGIPGAPEGMTVQHIANGVVYEIPEGPEPRGFITADNTQGVQVVNKRDTTELTIDKTVVSDIEADADIPFLFTVKLEYPVSAEEEPEEPPMEEVKSVRPSLKAAGGEDDEETGYAPINGVYSGIHVENGIAKLWLKHGESVTLKGLPVGTRYTVLEVEDPRFSTKVNDEEVDKETVDDLDGFKDTGDLTTTEGAQVSFTNTRKTGELEITKTVEGPVLKDEADMSFKFDILLNDAISGDFTIVKDPADAVEGSGEDDEVEPESSDAPEVAAKDPTVAFNNGKATITLKAGQKATISGLPDGVTYTVLEHDYPKFKTESSDETGLIETGKPATAAFTNTRKLGDLAVTKTVKSVDPADETKSFNFTVTLDDETITGPFDTDLDGVEGKAEFKDGAYTFELKDGETLKITGLPTGIGYTVAEEDYEGEGFVTVATGDTGTICLAESVAGFVNIKAFGGLVVNKTVQSAIDADHERKYDITVTIQKPVISDDENAEQTYETNTAISGQYGEATFTAGVANLKLADGDIVVITGLPNGAHYVVEEHLAKDDDVTVTYEGEVGDISHSGTAHASVVNKRNLIDLSVLKVWEDDDDRDGLRPVELSVTLSNDANDDTWTVALNEDNDWTATVKDLPEYKIETDEDGNVTNEKIEYTWTEGKLSKGYKWIGNETDKTTGITTITNRHEVEKTEATVVKAWNDNENQDGVRPAELTVTLLANGKPYMVEAEQDETAEADEAAEESAETEMVPKTVLLNEANKWTDTVTDLPKYENGELITYSWDEGAIEGYTLTDTRVEGTVTTLTNSRGLDETIAKVTKVWADNDDQYGLRPAELTVTLNRTVTTGEGEDSKTETTAVQSFVLKKDNDWTATAEHLPKYENGQEIGYSWVEGAMPEGYELTDTKVEDITEGEGEAAVVVGKLTTLTNTYTFEFTEATVVKVWDDNENQDGVRPESLTVTLLADGEPYKVPGKLPEDAEEGAVAEDEIVTVTLNEANKWTAKVSDLPKFKDGKEIAYSWQEGAMPEGYVLTGNSTEGTVTTLTNTYGPETTEAKVIKVWEDDDNAAGLRPEELYVTLSNGTIVMLNEANEWTATVKDLPKYADGKPIDYTWTEGALPEGYSLTNTKVEDITEGEGEAAVVVGTVTTLTNTYVPEETTEATVIKKWVDGDNAAGLRPEELYVTLMDGEREVTIVKLTPDEKGEWTATVTDLPKFRDGEEIKYSWTEGLLPEGYSLTNTLIEGTVTTLTNTYVPEETTEATVIKIWEDDDNAAGLRPEELYVTLMDGETEVAIVKLVPDEKGVWTATVKDLPKYRDGKEIVYTWVEGALPEGYTLTGNRSKDETDEAGTVIGTVTTLTNTYGLDYTSATVQKVWVDSDNEYGLRPQFLQVTLLADGEATDRYVILSEENGWTDTIDKLPKLNEEGEEIVYSWDEGDPTPYTAAITEPTEEDPTLTVITNTYGVTYGEYDAVKNWTGSEGTAKLTLVGWTRDAEGNEEQVSTDTKKVSGNGKAHWSDLPKYTEDGRPILYTLKEEGVSKDGKIGDDVISSIYFDTDKYSWVVTNHEKEVPPTPKPTTKPTATPKPTRRPGGGGGNPPTPVETPVPKTDISGRKVWNDEGNAHNTRPSSVTVQLLADGEVVDSKTVSGSGNTWNFAFTDLPEVDEDGDTIHYTLREVSVDGYTSSVSGTTITNTLIPRETEEYIDLSGRKTWKDDGNAAGKRPTHITVRLLRDGEEVRSLNVTAGTDWRYSFKDLPADDGYGNTYTYTIKEDGVPGYFTRYDGMNITNTLFDNPTPDEPEEPDKPDTPPTPNTPTPEIPTRKTGTPPPAFEDLGDEELEELFDLFGYDTPLFGMLGTGDEVPAWVWACGAGGIAALAAALILGRKKKKRKA